MSNYEAILNARTDMTNWLIHFTKRGEGLSARDRLIKILKEEILEPGWSIRKNKSTVYGPYPIVCFSEQPLWAFKQYLDARDDPQSMSGYGIIIHKSDAYAEGALPAIYGLENANEAREDDSYYQPGKRILDPKIISLEEQYRYVVFNPNASRGPIDWSHEREWRWSANAIKSKQKKRAFYLTSSEISSNKGMSEGRAHIFVQNDTDIDYIRNALVSTTKNYRPETTIVSLETMKQMVESGDKDFMRFDTWPEEHKIPLAL